MRRLPPLRALEAFVRVVRLGSARAAAAELGLSPSALSRRIAGLEEFTGRKLFSRTGQAMELTDEGGSSTTPWRLTWKRWRSRSRPKENLQLLRLGGACAAVRTQRLFRAA